MIDENLVSPSGIVLCMKNLLEEFREISHQRIGLLFCAVQPAQRIMRSIADGTITVVTVPSEGSPTPQAFYMLNELVEVPEMVAPESSRRDNLSRMKTSLLAQEVQFACLHCGSVTPEKRTQGLPDFPKCSRCGSGLLALVNKIRADVPVILEKWKSKQELTVEERGSLSHGRRTADLVLSYGKQAVTALPTWGVGPQTAASILAKMHTREEDFIC